MIGARQFTRGPQALLVTRGVQLLLLALVASAAFIARTSLGPLQETMRMALGMSDNQLALLQGPPLALGVIGAIPLGLLIDRYSRVRLMIWLGALFVAADLVCAGSSSFPMLFVARCLTGLAAAATWMAVLSLIADWYAPEQRGRATMVVAIGAVAGMSAAFALGGALLAGGGPGPDIWRWALRGLGIPLLISWALILALREPARKEEGARKPAAQEVYATLWHYRPVLIPLALAFTLVGGIADGAAVVWAAPMLARGFALGPERVGAIMAAILLISGLLGPVLGGLLADLSQRLGGPRSTIRALMWLLCFGIPTGLFAIAPNAAAACVLLGLYLTVGTAFQVAVQALVTIVIPNALRASCLAWLLAVCLLFAFGVAPMLVSQLSGLLGSNMMIGKSLAWVCVTFSIAGLAALWLGRRAF